MPFGNFILTYDNTNILLTDTSLNLTSDRSYDYTHTTKHNVVLNIKLQDKSMLNELIKFSEKSLDKINELHILNENMIIICHFPVVENFKFDISNINQTADMNIISHHMEVYLNPIEYMRKKKLEKIISKINGDR